MSDVLYYLLFYCYFISVDSCYAPLVASSLIHFLMFNVLSFFFCLESFTDVDADFHARIPVVMCREKQRSWLSLCVF